MPRPLPGLHLNVQLSRGFLFTVQGFKVGDGGCFNNNAKAGHHGLFR